MIQLNLKAVKVERLKNNSSSLAFQNIIFIRYKKHQ
jgi:hypothetical protein